jgi:hypothetical protein
MARTNPKVHAEISYEHNQYHTNIKGISLKIIIKLHKSGINTNINSSFGTDIIPYFSEEDDAVLTELLYHLEKIITKKGNNVDHLRIKRFVDTFGKYADNAGFHDYLRKN